LPAERVWAEVEKWLLQSRRPSIGLHAARELGIAEKLWPEIHALVDCPQDPNVHPEGDVFVHTGMVLDETRKLIDDLPRPKQIAVMLGALCHDLGKPATTKVEEPSPSTKTHEEDTKEDTGHSGLLREPSCDFVGGTRKISARGHEAVSVALTE